jgi:hypothetical protein
MAHRLALPFANTLFSFVLVNVHTRRIYCGTSDNPEAFAGNIASGFAASVSGGATNTASGPVASVNGGLGKTASTNLASVSGGAGNTASGDAASVIGGQGVTDNKTNSTAPQPPFPQLRQPQVRTKARLVSRELHEIFSDLLENVRPVEHLSLAIDSGTTIPGCIPALETPSIMGVNIHKNPHRNV